ncbi:transketolase [Brevibacillus borstelensis]|uniref:transketolase n=1 Tax=Brevibacillus borstelensis TaxID=45462 RepID=UPI002E20521C|nr:transketolase [Brevibacillus borstelensis]
MKLEHAIPTRDEAIQKIASMNKRMRKLAFDMALSAGSNGAHLGGGLSIMELLATLYGGIMKYDPQNPYWEARDRFILSKGHGVLAYYSALAEAGFFSADELEAFEQNMSPFGGHPVLNMPKGIEFSSGSLGMGLSFGLGIALAKATHRRDYNVYVLLGDGECNEGSVWEAAMAAAHYQAGNLIAVIDRNNLQYDGPNNEVMNLMNFADKWRSFGWEAVEIDGHSIPDIYDAFTNENRDPAKPYVVIANTVKGKGVSFMENNRDWHHNRLTQTQYEQAIAELENY